MSDVYLVRTTMFGKAGEIVSNDDGRLDAHLAAGNAVALEDLPAEHPASAGEVHGDDRFYDDFPDDLPED